MRKLKRFFIAKVLLIVVLLIATSCTKMKELKFGIMMPNFETSYFTDAINCFEKHFAEKGGQTIAK